MKKISTLTIIGTRPEGLKLAPLVQQLAQHPRFDSRVCVTGQHREMLEPILNLFEIEVHDNLNLMQPNQSLATLTSLALTRIDALLQQYQPDWVIVQGDTTSAFAAAMAAFYHKIPVAHVEAGLRTHQNYSPFPEEINRVFIDKLASMHFAPTAQTADHLLQEGHDKSHVFVTGNTIIDTLLMSVEKLNADQAQLKKHQRAFSFLNPDKKTILVTCHRRENHGDGFSAICQALSECANRTDVQIVYPVHLNPNIQNTVNQWLPARENVHLIKPQSYLDFIYLMQQSHLIVTDSGGIQEEAPSLNKPVLVVRDTTERPEAVASGAVRLIGTNTQTIIAEITELLESEKAYRQMSQAQNPYGDGTASTQIIEHLLRNAHE